MEYRVERVRAAVRVKRRAKGEVFEGVTVSLSGTSKQHVGIKSRNGKGTLEFTVDVGFDEESTQAEVYECVAPLVRGVADGINTTVLAYGQTGSGKTFTMLGEGLEEALRAGSARGNPVALAPGWGVIPRAVTDLFELLHKDQKGGSRHVEVTCSYMQIYQDRLYDLLTDGKMQNPLQVREGAVAAGAEGDQRREAGVFVRGLSQYRVGGVGDVLELLRRGSTNRAVRATEYNLHSSRSHAILQISVEVESNDADSLPSLTLESDDSRGASRASSRGGTGSQTSSRGGAGSSSAVMRELRRAKLSLVDLAGSEKWGDQAYGQKDVSKELTAINGSLSALGNCIAALAERGRKHVPFRDSSLTRLLQDSLGGNCRTLVLATVSPESLALEETASTLGFATRATQVTAKLMPNQVINDAVLLARATKQIARLKQQLALTSSGNFGGHMSRPTSPIALDMHPAATSGLMTQASRDRLEEEVNRLRLRVQELEAGDGGSASSSSSGHTARGPPPAAPLYAPMYSAPTSAHPASRPGEEQERLPTTSSLVARGGSPGDSPRDSSAAERLTQAHPFKDSCRSASPRDGSVNNEDDDGERAIFGPRTARPSTVSRLDLRNISTASKQSRPSESSTACLLSSRSTPIGAATADVGTTVDDAAATDTSEQPSDSSSVNTLVGDDTAASTEGAGATATACFARALYDFRSDEAGDLTVDTGDLVAVEDKALSGWWTGRVICLGDERTVTLGPVGMFPCHYVEVLDGDEGLRRFFPGVDPGMVALARLDNMRAEVAASSSTLCTVEPLVPMQASPAAAPLPRPSLELERIRSRRIDEAAAASIRLQATWRAHCARGDAMTRWNALSVIQAAVIRKRIATGLLRRASLMRAAATERHLTEGSLHVFGNGGTAGPSAPTRRPVAEDDRGRGRRPPDARDPRNVAASHMELRAGSHNGARASTHAKDLPHLADQDLLGSGRSHTREESPETITSSAAVIREPASKRQNGRSSTERAQSSKAAMAFAGDDYRARREPMRSEDNIEQPGEEPQRHIRERRRREPSTHAPPEYYAVSSGGTAPPPQASASASQPRHSPPRGSCRKVLLGEARTLRVSPLRSPRKKTPGDQVRNASTRLDAQLQGALWALRVASERAERREAAALADRGTSAGRKKSRGSPWVDFLWRELDTDGSGLLGADDLKRLARKRLGLERTLVGTLDRLFAALLAERDVVRGCCGGCDDDIGDDDIEVGALVRAIEATAKPRATGGSADGVTAKAKSTPKGALPSREGQEIVMAASRDRVEPTGKEFRPRKDRAASNARKQQPLHRNDREAQLRGSGKALSRKSPKEPDEETEASGEHRVGRCGKDAHSDGGNGRRSTKEVGSKQLGKGKHSLAENSSDLPAAALISKHDSSTRGKLARPSPKTTPTLTPKQDEHQEPRREKTNERTRQRLNHVSPGEVVKPDGADRQPRPAAGTKKAENSRVRDQRDRHGNHKKTAKVGDLPKGTSKITWLDGDEPDEAWLTRALEDSPQRKGLPTASASSSPSVNESTAAAARMAPEALEAVRESPFDRRSEDQRSSSKEAMRLPVLAEPIHHDPQRLEERFGSAVARPKVSTPRQAAALRLPQILAPPLAQHSSMPSPHAAASAASHSQQPQVRAPAEPPVRLPVPKPALLHREEVGEPRGPCARHGLSDCVLCSLSLSAGSTARVHAPASYAPTPVAAAKSIPQYSTYAPPPAAPCARHGLSGCVLCSGTFPIIQAPVKAPSNVPAPDYPYGKIGGSPHATLHGSGTFSNYLTTAIDPSAIGATATSATSAGAAIATTTASVASCARHGLAGCFLCSLKPETAPLQPPLLTGPCKLPPQEFAQVDAGAKSEESSEADEEEYRRVALPASHSTRSHRSPGKGPSPYAAAARVPPPSSTAATASPATKQPALEEHQQERRRLQAFAAISSSPGEVAALSRVAHGDDVANQALRAAQSILASSEFPG